MSESFAQGYFDMIHAKNEGMDERVARMPESGTPTSFRRWCEQVFKPAVRILGPLPGDRRRSAMATSGRRVC